jgi:acyl-CoA thioesterase I
LVVTGSEAMMNGLIYHVMSGQAFFSGAALVQLALLSTFAQQRAWLAAARIAFAGVGLLLIAVSATPLPEWFYFTAGPLVLTWAGLECSSKTQYRRRMLGLRWAVMASLWLGIALELPYHFRPTVNFTGGTAVYVVGDSLSSGIGGDIETWPKRLAREHGGDVRDLSVAGTDVTTAMKQAERVSGGRSLVLAEIGGNDILRKNPLDIFEHGLDALLARLRQGNHTIVMLELPLYPFYNRYGDAQRRLARRHGALLIPKRVLLEIFTTPGATLDSIHLSAAGHQLMAQSIWSVLEAAEAKKRDATLFSKESRPISSARLH